MRVRALIGVVLAAAGAAIAAVIGLARRRDPSEGVRLAVLRPLLVRAGVAAEDIGPLTLLDEWKLVDKGGDLDSGTIGPLDVCPCQHEYTVNTTLLQLANRPAKAAIPGLLNYPPVNPPDWTCVDDCVQVMTHRWRGWYLGTDGQVFTLASCQFAQYHCKKPTDPARDQPPIEGPPGPEA